MSRPPWGMLALLWIVTFALAALFAWRTPAWQAPDEPAHYAYVATIAETGRPPLLVAGCYDERYKNELVGGNFAAPIDFSRFCYEGHQPPLFYTLAAPIYAATKGSLLALRLFAAALGAFVPVVAWLLVRQLGGDRLLALGVAGIVALVPQHLAMLGALNNDALTYLLVALSFWQMLRVRRAPSVRGWLGLGLLVGLALITKTLAWVVLPLAFLTAWLLPAEGTVARLRRSVNAATLVVAVAALFVLPWMARNVATYPGADPLALVQHERIAEGQPRTAEEIAQRGVVGTVLNGAQTLFNSFWGQFGWMKSPLREGEYIVLALFSLAGTVGLLRWAARGGWRPEGLDGGALLLCAAWVALSAGLVLYYNLEFVQYQGRYLFPALTPIVLFLLIGLGAWWPRRLRALPWAALALFLLYLDGMAIWQRLPGMSSF